MDAKVWKAFHNSVALSIIHARLIFNLQISFPFKKHTKKREMDLNWGKSRSQNDSAANDRIAQL